MGKYNLLDYIFQIFLQNVFIELLIACLCIAWNLIVGLAHAVASQLIQAGTLAQSPLLLGAILSQILYGLIGSQITGHFSYFVPFETPTLVMVEAKSQLLKVRVQHAFDGLTFCLGKVQRCQVFEQVGVEFERTLLSLGAFVL
jgi:hypothetical protein